jgi:hypothetical protein
MRETCKPFITKGQIFRYAITIVSLSIYAAYVANTGHTKYIYLILPILLWVLDSTDNLFLIHNIHTKKICTKTFDYQLSDKICDAVSYVLVYLVLCVVFKVDHVLGVLILYRIIGVFLFCLTKESVWLIVFFDFVKEYLFYLFIFGKNDAYIPLFMIGKIGFEYYWHKVQNDTDYNV